MAVARGVYESTKADYSPLVRLGDRFTGNSFSPSPPLLLPVFTPRSDVLWKCKASRGGFFFTTRRSEFSIVEKRLTCAFERFNEKRPGLGKMEDGGGGGGRHHFSKRVDCYFAATSN